MAGNNSTGSIASTREAEQAASPIPTTSIRAHWRRLLHSEREVYQFGELALLIPPNNCSEVLYVPATGTMSLVPGHCDSMHHSAVC